MQNAFGIKTGRSALVRQEGGARNNISQPGVGILFLREDLKTLRGRILPAFDESQPDGDAYAKSFIPYRDKSKIDTQTGAAEFTQWYGVIGVYRFFGAQSEDFLSFEHNKDDMIVTMMRWLVANTDKKGAQYIKQKDDPMGMKGPKKLEWPRQCAFVNFLNLDPKEGPKVMVLFMSRTGLLDGIMKRLDIPRPAMMTTVADKNWAEYLYGDVTRPGKGLVGRWCEDQSSAGGMKSLALQFSDEPLRINNPLTGATVADVTPEHLKARFQWQRHPEKVFQMITRQQSAEKLIESGIVPMDLIREAIGNLVTLPEPTFSTGQARGAAISGGSRALGESAASSAGSRALGEGAPSGNARTFMGGISAFKEEAFAGEPAGPGAEQDEIPGLESDVLQYTEFGGTAAEETFRSDHEDEDAPPLLEDDDAPPALEDELPPEPEPAIYWAGLGKEVLKPIKTASEIRELLKQHPGLKVCLKGEKSWQEATKLPEFAPAQAPTTVKAPVTQPTTVKAPAPTTDDEEMVGAADDTMAPAMLIGKIRMQGRQPNDEEKRLLAPYAELFDKARKGDLTAVDISKFLELQKKIVTLIG